jgi:hypothetical protein
MDALARRLGPGFAAAAHHIATIFLMTSAKSGDRNNIIKMDGDRTVFGEVPSVYQDVMRFPHTSP